MNRPERPKGMLNPKYLYFAEYIISLEKYCDELEKAIDWACFWLRYYSDTVSDGCFGYDFDEDKWKEWLLKDESIT